MLVCVCVSAPEGINNSGMILCDIGSVRLVKHVSWLFPAFNYFIRMTLTIDKMDGCGHINTACHERLPKKTEVTWYCTSYKRTTGKTEHFIYKSEWANA